MKEWTDLIDEGVGIAGPMPVKVSYSHEGQRALGVAEKEFAIYLDLWTTDAHDGTEQACISRAFAPESWPGRAAAIQQIFDEIVQLVTHELAERFHVGNERPLDPHREASL